MADRDAVQPVMMPYGVRGRIKKVLSHRVVFEIMKGLEELVPEEKERKRKGIVHL